MTDYYCENCEFFEDRSTDKLIDGFCEKYNQPLTFYNWWEKCDKCIIDTLRSENAALHERIDKAVEVLEKLKEEIEPRVYKSFFGFVVQVRTLQEHKEIYGTEEDALARLAELKGGDHE